MTKSLEVSGKTEQEAIDAALLELGLDRDDVSVEIVERAKSGFLGIGAQPAVVKVTYEAPDEPETEEPVIENKPVEVKPVSEKKQKEAKPAKTEEKAEEKQLLTVENSSTSAEAQKVVDFLQGLLKHMNVEAGLKLSDTEEGGINVIVYGPNMGSVIGRRGETLDSIQHLTNYAVNHGGEKRVHISIDAENYRARREESLIKLADKMAGKVLKYRRSMALEPMNSYERHVIHTALQDYEGVTTCSTGTEPNRRVVISCERGSKTARKQHSNYSKSQKQNKSAEAPKAVETAAETAPAAEVKTNDSGSKKPISREWA